MTEFKVHKTQWATVEVTGWEASHFPRKALREMAQQYYRTGERPGHAGLEFRIIREEGKL